MTADDDAMPARQLGPDDRHLCDYVAHWLVQKRLLPPDVVAELIVRTEWERRTEPRRGVSDT